MGDVVGKTNGPKRLVTDEQLDATRANFVALHVAFANACSPTHGRTCFGLKTPGEPGVSRVRLVPVDGEGTGLDLTQLFERDLVRSAGTVYAHGAHLDVPVPTSAGFAAFAEVLLERQRGGVDAQLAAAKQDGFLSTAEACAALGVSKSVFMHRTYMRHVLPTRSIRNVFFWGNRELHLLGMNDEVWLTRPAP